MNEKDIDTFFATLRAANPSPASELHYASVSPRRGFIPTTAATERKQAD